MVRSYLRHEPTSAFGVVASNAGRAILDSDGKTAYVAALEDVLVWDVRRGEQLAMWHDVGHRSPVTALARSLASPNMFAVGYEDGSVRIWDASSPATPSVTFHGHKRAITAMAFDEAGMRLATASQDTTVILWDLVAETGLFRLKGHRDAITDVAFVPAQPSATSASATASSSSTSLNANTHLVSTSKDGLLKLWDLDLQQSIQTVVPGKGELCSLAILPVHDDDDASLLLTGSSEGEVKAWTISGKAIAAGLTAVAGEDQQARFIEAIGSLEVASKRRVTQMAFGGKGRSGTAAASHLAITSSDRSVQIFRLREEEEMRKKMARRARRQKEKAASKGAAPAAALVNGDGEEKDAELPKVTWLDRIEAYTILRPESGRLRSFAFPSGSDAAAHSSSLPILCATNANSLEVYSIPPPPSKADKKASTSAPEPVLSCSLELPGHRSEARAIALSSDDALLASADSSGVLKVWNIKTGKCVRTIAFGAASNASANSGAGYALCLSWLPGDRYVLVGCKDGSIVSVDVPAGEVVEVVKSAHSGPVWSVAVHPDGMRCVSASADKDVKFWDFEMRASEGQDAPQQPRGDEEDEEDEEERPPTGPTRLALVHTRTLKMTDDVLFARFSPRDGRLLALSLLDNTVKVFFTDSLKFFLSLYGHKLPVLSLDISADDKLCVTCSADKNVKICECRRGGSEK